MSINTQCAEVVKAFLRISDWLGMNSTLCFSDDETRLNPLISSPRLLMMKVKKAEVPEKQAWRIETLDFLLKVRREREARMENTETISSVIDALCSV